MNLSLSLKKSPSGDSAGLLVFGIPVWYRIMTLSIAGTLIASSLVAGVVGPGWIVVALAACASMYEERWTFDHETREVRGRLGLVFAHKGPRFSFDDVARVSVNLFAKGKLDQTNLPEPDKMSRGSQARLIIELKDGQSVLVDSVNVSSRERLLDNARKLADFMDVPLE